MRRVLVLFSVFAATLLGTGMGSVAAAPVPRAAVEIERELSFALPAPAGFKAAVSVSNDDGDVSALLIVTRGRQVAYYSTPAKVTAERVTARFGGLGELDYRFAPKGKESAECLGTTGPGEARFEGTFTFTGENSYIQIEADHAEGTVQTYPAPKGCVGARRDRRVVRYQPSYSGKGATLDAVAGSPRQGVVREVNVLDDGLGDKIDVIGLVGEKREGMQIARGAQVAAGRGAFHFNLKAGTASLRAPDPFTGSAKFSRRPGGRASWEGSLRVPILGGEPVELAGSAFRASIHKGVPEDE
jgi:hypothetical protein